jgi:hypothetical protein
MSLCDEKDNSLENFGTAYDAADTTICIIAGAAITKQIVQEASVTLCFMVNTITSGKGASLLGDGCVSIAVPDNTPPVVIG